jgi:hypothetical protein
MTPASSVLSDCFQLFGFRFIFLNSLQYALLLTDIVFPIAIAIEIKEGARQLWQNSDLLAIGPQRTGALLAQRFPEISRGLQYPPDLSYPIKAALWPKSFSTAL